eukprot:GFUD01032990.1.p1 GENE.GFUD01032990.1~~GFUD01032990.1.p1  ORF type:complete len:782 (+),score=209.86 GFUD01032990.1:240-2585(+)
MNFTQPPPNYLPQRPPASMNLNQTKFTNQHHALGRHPNLVAGRHSNHSFVPRHKAPNGHGHQPHIPSRQFPGPGRVPGQGIGPGPALSHPTPGQLYHQAAAAQVLKQEKWLSAVGLGQPGQLGHPQVPPAVQNHLIMTGPGVGQVRPQNGVFLSTLHSGQGVEPATQSHAGSPSTASNGSTVSAQAHMLSNGSTISGPAHLISNGSTISGPAHLMSNGSPAMFSTGLPAIPPHHLQALPRSHLLPGGYSNGSQVVSSPGVSSPNLPAGISSQCFQLPYNALPQVVHGQQVSLPPGLVLQQPAGAAGPAAPQGGAMVYSQQTPQGVQLYTQPGTPYPLYQPGGQAQAVPGGTPGVGLPVQYLVQGQPSVGHVQPTGGVSPYLYHPQPYPPTPSLPQAMPGAPTPVPPTPPSANIPLTQFPPPGLFSQPPPNYPPVSPSPRQVSPRYHTPPKSPCPTSPPVYLSPPMTGLVPVFPLTPGPTPDCVPYIPPADKHDQPNIRPGDIPDLRHQFLTNQFLPQPGQVVLLPPLPPDRSVQTIQLLTPGLGGQFTVQTIVLPIIKVENTQPAHQLQGDKVVARQVVQEVEDIKQHNTTVHSEIVIKAEDDSILLNEVDSTGLPKVMQGIDLEQVKQFAAEFKSARLNLGLTQTQVGQALTSSSSEEGVAVSQSTICRFEKLEITALQVKKLLPALQTWLQEAKERHKQGLPIIVQDSMDGKDNKKRKKRTVFNQDTVNALCIEFERQPSPSSSNLAEIADRMGLDKETVRVWFCNKRQNLKKNTSGTI